MSKQIFSYDTDTGLFPAAFTTAVTAAVIPKGMLNAKTYGAVGDGTTDDTSALQAAITDAQNLKATLVIPAGTYKVSATLTTAQQFYQPNIVGVGAKATILNGTGAISILKIVGGSGGLAISTIRDIGFTGTTATGIELAACDGITITKCRFNGLAGGVLFNNSAAGSFTEFNVVRESTFEADCILPIEYRRGSGNESFHGSGFADCVFQQASSGTGPIVKVGAGCLVYGSPWDGTFFLNSAAPVFRIDSTRRTFTYGSLRFEASNAVPILDPASAVDYAYHQGDIFQLGEGLQLGKRFIISERVRVNADGSVSSLAKKQTTETAMTSGTTSVTSQLQGDCILGVRISGPNYEMGYLLFAHRNTASSGGSITTLAFPEDFDNTGWGHCTFALTSSYVLTITNSTAAFNATAYVTVNQVASAGHLT